MRNFYFVVAAFVFTATPALDGRGQESRLACFDQSVDQEARIEKCTAFLSSNDLPLDTRALALSVRADSYVATAQFADALRDYDEALSLVPTDIHTRIGRGKAHEQLNQFDVAISDYSQVIKTAPVNEVNVLGEAYARRGALRIEAGDIDQGISDLGEARRLDPRNPLPFKTRGAYFLEQDNLEQAAAELGQAVEGNAGDLESQLMLGSVQLKRGQSEDAARAFTTALIVDPGNADALQGRATAYGQMENYAAAISDYTAVLNIKGRNAAAFEGRGVALLRIGSYAAAESDFTDLLTLKPNDAGALFFRATARFQKGDPEGAETDFSEVLAIRPADMDALVGRGISRQFSGNYDGAEDDLTAVLEKLPDAAHPLANRGYTRLMKGDIAGSIEDLSAAMELPNASAHVALWHFVATARAGNKDEAILHRAKLSLKDDQWPLPIVRYFLGELSGDEIINAALENASLATGRLCEAYFFLGQAALILKDKTEAERLFRATLETNAVRFTEHAGAKAELERLSDSKR